MKKNILILFFLLAVMSFGYGQYEVDWDKIIIADGYGNCTSAFYNEFHIDKKRLSIYNPKNPDSLIKKVEPTLINEILKSITPDSLNEKDPLLAYNIDSLWLKENAELLWEEYLNGRNEIREIDSFAVATIRDYSKLKGALQQGMDFELESVSIVSFMVINHNDTTKLYTSGQAPYLLPWILNTQTLYNPRLSLLISKLLPNQIRTNKGKLSGKEFDRFLIESIYYQFIEEEANFLRARNKYSHRFKKLEKHFEIVNAELSIMGSIEWGGRIAARCLELSMKDTSISKNIQFSAIFGRRVFLFPVNTIIRKKKKLLDQLKNNLVFQYAINNDNCLGEIHFVNNKSLSRQAKREFLRDAKSKGLDMKPLKGKFRNAIFFELREERKESFSFSRWIFLKDGTMILWEIEGDFLMKLPDSFFTEKGYVCKIVKVEDIKKSLSKTNQKGF